MPISNPVDPIAAHLGGGIVQVFSGYPVSGNFDRFEVQVSMTLAGPYQLFSNRTFKNRDGWIYGFPVGGTAYLQIRAIAVDGSVSDWVQVKKAILNKIRVRMSAKAIQGSRISESAVFVTRKAENRLLAFRSLEEVNFI